MWMAVRDRDAYGCERWHAAALAEQRQALELSRPGSAMHARHTINLAWIGTSLALQAGLSLGDDLDRAIKTVRRALRRLRLVAPYAERAEGYLVLADMLMLRSRLDPLGGPIGEFAESLWPTRPQHGIVRFLWWERGTHDMLRAAGLYAQLSLRGGEHAPQARARFPELTQLMRSGQLSFMRGPAGRVGGCTARCSESSRVSSTDSAVDLAQQWAAWAIEHGDARQAGEAYWCWINAVVAESRRRVFLADKERRLSQVQGLPAEAVPACWRPGVPATRQSRWISAAPSC